ncbi:hypothetical protein SynRCC2555_01863 [Synechococcus sp. WH 8101]|nr:hypothetical protein SynRCC2555_01863 [Synechococcus sp. WH 8101]
MTTTQQRLQLKQLGDRARASDQVNPLRACYQELSRIEP